MSSHFRILALLAALLPSPTLSAAESVSAMVQVRLSGGLVEGRPLAWSNAGVFLLARDGQMVVFHPDRATDLRKSAPRFYGYSPSEMRARLHAEFDRSFDITATQHYVVVHPRGQKNQWAERFEDLYRSFVHYFRVRGFSLGEPEFPLVAVIFSTEQEYQRYSREQGMKISPNFLGHYSTHTNRIYLYDTTTGAGGDWSQNAETIIHEAAHQTAYNTGVHSRFAGTPRWLSEGLAMMFESPGVWNSSRYRSRQHRINRGRLADFEHFLKQRPEAFFARLVASDQGFQASPAASYAEAWAFSFYLSETRPRLYSAYLARTAARPALEEYTSSQRMADFTAVFGKNLRQLDAQFLRYMERVD